LYLDPPSSSTHAGPSSSSARSDLARLSTSATAFASYLCSSFMLFDIFGFLDLLFKLVLNRKLAQLGIELLSLNLSSYIVRSLPLMLFQKCPAPTSFHHLTCRSIRISLCVRHSQPCGVQIQGFSWREKLPKCQAGGCSHKKTSY